MCILMFVMKWSVTDIREPQEHVQCKLNVLPFTYLRQKVNNALEKKHKIYLYVLKVVFEVIINLFKK